MGSGNKICIKLGSIHEFIQLKLPIRYRRYFSLGAWQSLISPVASIGENLTSELFF